MPFHWERRQLEMGMGSSSRSSYREYVSLLGVRFCRIGPGACFSSMPRCDFPILGQHDLRRANRIPTSAVETGAPFFCSIEWVCAVCGHAESWLKNDSRIYVAAVSESGWSEAKWMGRREEVLEIVVVYLLVAVAIRLIRIKSLS